MATITTRREFIDYCLRKLGFPVIEINVDDEQIEDRVDDAFLYWQDYHYDGTERTYYSHQITEDDILNKYITLPESIISVIRALPLNSTNMDIMNDPSLGLSGGIGVIGTGSGGSLSGSYGGIGSTSDHAGGGSDGTGVLTNTYISLQAMAGFEYMFSGEHPIRFNRHTDKLHIDSDWSISMEVGNYIMVEGYSSLNRDTYPDVYNDRWLKEYATSLIKRQWAQNLIKYEGMQLPGGMTFNGRQLYDDAVTEIDKLEEQIQMQYELPPMFFTG